MSKVIGFICGNDELDLSLGATDVVIYPTIEALKKAKKCVDECGVVEVLLGEVIQQPMSLEEIVKRAREKT